MSTSISCPQRSPSTSVTPTASTRAAALPHHCLPHHSRSQSPLLPTVCVFIFLYFYLVFSRVFHGYRWLMCHRFATITSGSRAKSLPWHDNWHGSRGLKKFAPEQLPQFTPVVKSCGRYSSTTSFSSLVAKDWIFTCVIVIYLISNEKKHTSYINMK